MTYKTYDEFEEAEGFSPVSPEAYYAERAWNAALESQQAASVGEVRRLREALRKIMEAHRFNVSGLPPTEVHSICFDALSAQQGEAE